MEISLTRLIVLPLIVFAAAGFVLFDNYQKTGDFVIKDVDLKGGNLITIETPEPVSSEHVERLLSAEFGSVFVSGLQSATGYGAKIEVASEVKTSDVISVLEADGIEITGFTEEVVGPALGQQFFEEITRMIAVAFILMSIVIFVIYRNPVSSFGIVFSGLANIVTTLAIVTFFGVSISFAGFAGLLMLIAYTIDTNIVLTTKVLKSNSQDFKIQYRRALKTGVMLIATITITMLIAMMLSSSKLLVNISQVLVVGFLVDLLFTWVFNAGLLEWWIRRKSA